MLHRKPFSIELAQQQLTAPYTPDSLLQAAAGYSFEASVRKVKADKLQKESFPLVEWLMNADTDMRGIGGVNTFNSAGFSSLQTQNIEIAFNQIKQAIGAGLSFDDFDVTAQQPQNNSFAEGGINVTTND